MVIETAVIVLCKVSLLIGTILLVQRMWRKAPAAQRHRLWSVGFGGLLLLPLLTLMLPGFNLPLPAWTVRGMSTQGASDRKLPALALFSHETAAASSELDASASRAPDASTGPGTAPPTRVWSFGFLVLLSWLIGLLAAVASLLVSLARVARLEASAEEVHDIEWCQARDRTARRLGLSRHVRVLASREVTTPMSGGVARPVVYVPTGAMMWDAERRDIVLAHEISHLASGDPFRQLIVRAACTLYWFHPLVWMGARRAAAACEQACDEAVVSLGIRSSTYANILLDFATAGPVNSYGVTLGMAHRASLETRLEAILSDTPRPTKNPHSFKWVASVTIVTVLLAAAHPATGTPHSLAVGRSTRIPGERSTPPSGTLHTATGHARAVGKVGPRIVPEDSAQSAPMIPVEASISPCDKESGNPMIGYGQVRSLGDDRLIQSTFRGLRICAAAQGLTGDHGDTPNDWLTRASRLVLETERANSVWRMAFVGGRVTEWTVNGRAYPVDGFAEVWRDELVAALDGMWEATRLDGAAMSMENQIINLRSQASALDVDRRVDSLRHEIVALDRDRLVPEMVARRDAAVGRLRGVLGGQ